MSKTILTFGFIIGIITVVFSQNTQVDWVYEFGKPRWWHWPLVLVIIYLVNKYAKKKYHNNK